MQRTGVGRRSVVTLAVTILADSDVTTAAATTLPSTGRTIPFLAAGVAVGIALLLRAGRSTLDDHPDDDPR